MSDLFGRLRGAASPRAWSVGVKIAAIIVAVGSLSFAVVVAVSVWTRSVDSYSAEMQANRSLTELLTQQVTGAVRWGKADVVEAAYADLAHGDGSQVATILVVDSSNKPLSSYVSKALPPFDLAAVLPDLVARAREGKGVTVLDRAAAHHVVVVPAYAGKERDYVGAVAIAWSEQRLAGEVRDAVKLEIAGALVGLMVLIAIMILALRWTVTGSLRSMTGAMARLAARDLTVDIPAADRRDEIGAMAQAVEVFKQAMIEAERLKAEQEAAERRAAAEKKEAMARVAAEFEAAIGAVVEGVSGAAEELQSSARSMSTIAEQASQQATAVAAASEQASANVQTVATAGEELSSSIAEISRQVGQSTQIAGQAVTEAQATDAKVQGLAEAAQKIGDVVKLINDIAGQTNLLALNATIEAARAGEAGKGFAVVASEVKSLANQTAKATEEIAAQINAIQGATRDSVEAIQSIGRTIAQVNEIATTIAAAVEQQGAATSEIARNVQEAARGTQEVSSNIGGVTETAAATGSAAANVLGAASDLSRQADTLRAQVDGFLAKVRAA